jgi:zinc protease
MMLQRPVFSRSLRRSLPALALAALCGAAARAAPGVDEPPLAGPARPLVVPDFEEATLANGVRLIVAARPALPIATVALHLRLGAAAEPEGLAGVASLTAQLRTKGATHAGRVLSASELARQAETLGSGLDSGSSWGGSTVSMTVATSKLEAATGLIASTVLRPTLAADELERLREQTADSLKLPLSNPMALAGMVAQRSAWGASVYGSTTTPASLARITLAEVQAFHTRQLRPELATLVISGDVSLAQARSLAERTLGSWKSNRMALPEPRHEAPAPQAPASVLVDLPGTGQSGVVVMAPSVALDSPERRVAQVAAAVLGGGFGARLNTEIRVKRGLSYGASAGNDMQPPGGVLLASAQTQHTTAAEVLGLMRSEISRLGQTAPPPEEVAARAATMVGSFGRQIETTAGLAATVLSQVERGRPPNDVQRFAPEVLAVTPAQVQDFAARHWGAKDLRSVVVGDLNAAGNSLKALDSQALVLKATQLDLEAARLQR